MQLTFQKINNLDLLILTRHLATMLKSGIPISEAMQSIVDESSSSSAKKILTKVTQSISSGATLSQSLGLFPNSFDALYVSVVKVAEQSGTLDEALAYLAQELKKSLDLRKKIQGAMMYPILVLSLTFVIGGAISFIILPQLVDFFTMLNVNLPLSTRILLSFATVMRDWGWLISVITILFIIAFKMSLTIKFVRNQFHIFLIRLPLFGRILKEASLAKLSRNLGIMLKSGIPLTSALQISLSTLWLLPLQTQLSLVYEQVKSGNKMGASLSKLASFYPNLFAKLISIGEKTGKLDESLLYLAEFYEEDVDETAKNISTLIEPFLLVVIGIIVALVAMAIISPIYELTGSIQ